MRRNIAAAVAAIELIEGHLDGPLSLDEVAAAVNCSKYHLHRLFAATVGMTIHRYRRRRQLTEAARLLVFSATPIIEIALAAGYESQQAFSMVFKELYKRAPNHYRKAGCFYPLQLRFRALGAVETLDEPELARSISCATLDDVPQWMELVRFVIDGYPCLDEASYETALKAAIGQRRALIMKANGGIIGATVFQRQTGSIDFFAVHPQYRLRQVERALISRIADDCLPAAEISITTFRSGDRADTGHRKAVKRLGFLAAEPLVELGYPTQRFVMHRDCARGGQAPPLRLG